ncbi:MAG TPA: ice-binding family protein [Polyangiales bacterium]|nr:ice-binding family protein [Polyangiales bacterium]
MAAAGRSGRGGAGAAAGRSGDAGQKAAAGHSGQSAGAGGAGHAGRSGSGAAGAAGAGDDGGSGSGAETYSGPTVGTAKRFAVLAYSSVTTANISSLKGSIGVSAAAVSVITGFDDAQFTKYGNDSLAPNADLTRLAQADVTTLVNDIDPRACDHDLTDVVGGLTGDITLHPGVTCMNNFSADVLIDGHVNLDAEGDPNAFFIIRGNNTLTVADGAQVVLKNDARDCGVFWRISKAVTIGKTVGFHGTVIAGSAITMKSASTLDGRALAQTEGVQLDANTITAPTDGDCPHAQ